LASEASEAIAEKLFVNEVAEMVGVEPVELVEVELEDDDELPHAAMKAPRATTSTATRIRWDFTMQLPSPYVLSEVELLRHRPSRRTVSDSAAAVQSR
jgi:hypothetical protein